MVLFLPVMFVYSKILGVFPLTFNKRTRRFGFSVSGSAYFILINGFTLIAMPFAIELVFQNHPMRTTRVFNTALRGQCLILYIISLASLVERLTMNHRTLDALNEHTDLADNLQNAYSLRPKYTLLLIMISLKCILPVNQLCIPYVFIAEGTHSSVWTISATCVLFFFYGQLFVIVNAWSLRNVSFRLLYDTINNHLSSIFDQLKYQKATRKQQFSFTRGLILCNDCKFSKAIDELADFNSAIYISVLRISSITPRVYLGVVTFQFVNNIFGLYHCYYLLQVALTTGDFNVIIVFGITTTWNFVDIFVLFLVCSLINEGSVCEGRKTLYRQFDTIYGNVHLDRSVS